MAKFTKSFDLWAEDENGVMHIDKIRSGELVIQRGQWVNICGERPSRWVGISPGGSVWAIHPKYKKGEQLQDFLTLARNVKTKIEWQTTDAERDSGDCFDWIAA